MIPRLVMAASACVLLLGGARWADAGEQEGATAGSEVLAPAIPLVKVGLVQFAVFPVTRAEFGIFAKATKHPGTGWQNPGFPQADNHPVVNVSWKDAQEYCAWLTQRERAAGNLKPDECFRLPTDLEWSEAVGLDPENGKWPEDRDMGVPNVYPWGMHWPPPAGTGNFAGEETKSQNPIKGYQDGFVYTSPVGQFKPLANGLYDMTGNVFQWVEDDWNKDRLAKTLRGSSWRSGAIQLGFLSSCRCYAKPSMQSDSYGFRVVKAVEGRK
jgi:formylglycine-generating enzyme required for sulfatase activity